MVAGASKSVNWIKEVNYVERKERNQNKQRISIGKRPAGKGKKKNTTFRF
jgi:hypothetical protein